MNDEAGKSQLDVNVTVIVFSREESGNSCPMALVTNFGTTTRNGFEPYRTPPAFSFLMAQRCDFTGES